MHTKGREIAESGFEVALYDIAPLSGLRFRTLQVRAGSRLLSKERATHPFEANRSIRGNSKRLARDSFATEGERERERTEKRLRVSLSLALSSRSDSRRRSECANVPTRDDVGERASERRAQESRSPRVRTRRCGGRTSANVASERASERAERETRRRNEYEIDRARERVKTEGKGRERGRTRRAERKDTPGACATISSGVKERRPGGGWACEGKR